jgi:hypothetical protein
MSAVLSEHAAIFMEEGRMFRFLLVVVAAITAGCVSVQKIPMSASSVEEIKDKEIALSQRARPDFAATTPARAAFGGLGGATTISEGNKIIKENGVEDPAMYIAHILASDLEGRYNTKLSPKGAPVASDEVADLVKNANGSDLVLDIRTINWSFVYFPTSWGKYRVIYSARLRLVDAKSGRVLAEGGCHRVPEQSAQAPSYGELLADSAARLKQELKTAAEFCISEFKTKTLAL